MLEVSDLAITFGTKPVLKGVSFQVPPQAICGLIGPGGGGKSVLLKIIAGVLKPDAGSVSLGVEPNELGLMFQEGALFDSLTVLDNIAFPLLHGRVPVALHPKSVRLEICEKAEWILEHVGLAHAAYKVPAQLSGGMRRRVSLARALVNRPKLLLLDDPTFGLDPVASNVIMKLICDLHASYQPTCLIVSQDLRRLLPHVQNFFFLDQGRIRFQGNLQQFRQMAEQDLKHFVECRYDLGNMHAAPAGN